MVRAPRRVRRRSVTLALATFASALLIGNSRAGAQTDQLDIPYEKFVLDNGLTLIVHEDRKAPIVAVNVWYHVGSKNEEVGRTGFAHLFEHLMFNGSENYNDDYFKVLEPLGATNLNGTTSNDRTNYFQNVPTSALDVVLWMESDRMGHQPGEARRATRRRAERKAAGREPTLRAGVQCRLRAHLSGRTSLLMERDRVDGGSRCSVARRGARVVRDLLRGRHRGDRHRG